MSTTVSYKGQTLTTVSNDTKTLLTEGKYLEDDLTLTDVSGGGAVLTTKNISANGTYNASSDSADGYSQVTVAVPASAVDTGTKNITANGTHDVVGYASANVNVPNSYSASDEGKVVSNGALVAQSSQNIDTNGTYDTTLKNEVVVNVSGGGGFSFDDIGEGNYSGADVVYTKSSIIPMAFYKANIKSFYAPNLVTINRANNTDLGDRVYCFASSSVETVNIPLLTQPQDQAFFGCASLKDVKMASATYIGAYQFSNCTSLTYLVGQSAGIVYTEGFRGCSNLEVVDLFGGDTSSGIRQRGFYGCAKLNNLILRSSAAVTKLENTGVFQSTPFASDGTGGTLYVPSALISSYQAATNWSTILGYANNSIQAIEGSIYETQYADGTPIT